MKERIRLLIESENLTSAALADKIGVQRSNISHILSGRNKPSLDFLQKLLKSFPDINSDWLITGSGDMNKTHIQGETLFDKKLDNTEEENKIKSEDTEVTNVNHATKTTKPEIKPIFQEKNLETLNIKRIIRIVNFYDDDTFKEFFPSE